MMAQDPATNCCDKSDIVIKYDNPQSCDTTVYFDYPDIYSSCPSGGTFVQISGPLSDSAPGAGDGTVLSPGTHTVEYIYSFGSIDYPCSFDIRIVPYQDFLLACKDINVSLDQNCETEVTPFMVLIGNNLGCEENFTISLTDAHGHDIGNMVNHFHVNEELTYNVCLAGGGNCCWGKIFVEDKYPPQIECPETPIIVPCNQLDYIDLNISNDNCTNVAELIVTNEIYNDFDCDPAYVAKVIRTYVAVDGNGATSLPCTVEIYLERVDLKNIDYPDDLTKFDNTALCCDMSNWYPDAFGNPVPEVGPCPNVVNNSNDDYEDWTYNENNNGESCTGSGSGVPTYNGYPLYPATPGFICNVFTSYSDQVLTQTDCVTKIMRTWHFREWHCTGEIFDSGAQIIEILDKTGPIIQPLDTIYASTAWGCEGGINLPPVHVHDDCADEFIYNIEFPYGSIQTNGGLVSIPVGTHTIRYTVYDQCYNRSYQDVVIVITDMTPPVAVCESTKVVSIPHSGNTPVWAETFDNGSWDDCYLDRFEVRRMETECDTSDLYFGETVSFCCADVGQNVMVVFRVYDSNGAYNDCMVEVHVQDKIDPNITCPDDITIFCKDDYDLDNPNFFFGSPIIEDNCSTPENVEQLFELDISQCQSGKIKREIIIRGSDGEIQSSCVQYIYIYPEDTFDEEDIDWPDDYQGSGCSQLNLEPQNLPPEFGFPYVYEGECDLVGYNYEDQVVEFAQGEGACYKIIRHWTVINWCEEIDEVFTTFEYYQELKVVNELPPTFAGACADLIFETANPDCEPEPFEWSMSAMDDCTMDLQWEYELDLNTDGVIDERGLTETIAGTYPPGTHTTYWKVRDRCGNFELCEQKVVIKNTKPPTAVCINGLSVDLVPMDFDNDGVIDNEMVTLWASDFNASSYHPCGDDIVFSFSADTTDIFLELDCENIGEYIVDLWVTSVETGAGTYCTTFVDVQDNNLENFCTQNGTGGATGSSRVSISGSILTEDGRYISQVEVYLESEDSSMALTGGTGEYLFDNMPTGGTYVVKPLKNIGHLNGVTTLDLVQIQRHILGIEKIESPYKIIAADANNTETVSSADLVELRKLILGIFDELPKMDSWRFVLKENQFEDDEKPFSSSFQESYNIFDLESDKHIEFVGIKIGDVNDSVILNLDQDNIETRSKTLHLEYDLVNVENSLVPVYLSEPAQLYGMQMNISTVASNSKILGLEAGQLDINKSHYHIDEQFGLLVSYSIGEILSLDAYTPLFYVQHDQLPSGLTLGSNKFRSEAYDDDFAIKDISLDASKSSLVKLGKVVPNPWSGEANVEISLDEYQKVLVEIFDLNGRLMYANEKEYSEGKNIITIQNNDIDRYGTLMMVVTGESFSKTLRMIHIR